MYETLPKTELHLHLDGSLPPEFILSRAKSRGIELDVTSAEELRPFLMAQKAAAVRSGNTHQSLNSNWGVFDFCNQFLQTREELRDATQNLLVSLNSAHNVVLCEVRFCPTLHTLEGLTPCEVVEAVLEGLEGAKAEVRGLFEAGVIICALRSRSPDEAVSLVELGSRYLDRGVVGFDVAGDEGSYPLEKVEASLVRAKELGVPVTVHAGEWPVNDKFGDSSLANLKLAVSHGVGRVGHGCQLYRDAELMSLVARTKLPVECCLTSNCAWKVPSYGVHPIKVMLEKGVVCCVNCDNTLLSGTAQNQANPTGELQHLADDVLRANGVDEQGVKEAVKKVLINGVEASFIWKVGDGPKRKEAFKLRFEELLDSRLGAACEDPMSSRSTSKWLSSYSALIAVVLLAVLISLNPAQGFCHSIARPVAIRRSTGLLRSSPISDMEGWLSKNGVNIDRARHSSFEDGTTNASVRGLKAATGGGDSLSSPLVNLPRKLTLSSSKEEGWDKDLATQLLREVAKGGRGEFSGYVSLLTNGDYGGGGAEAWGGGEDETGIPVGCKTMPLPKEWPAKDALRHWTSEEVDTLCSLGGAEAKRAVKAGNEQLRRWLGEVGGSGSGVERVQDVEDRRLLWFLWAMEVVYSRAFRGIGGGGGGGILALGAQAGGLALGGFGVWNNEAAVMGVGGAVAAAGLAYNVFKGLRDKEVLVLPYIDSANHDETSKLEILFNPRSSSFELVCEDGSPAPAKGEEIFISYGKRGPTDLLVNFGIVEGGKRGKAVGTGRQALAERFATTRRTAAK